LIKDNISLDNLYVNVKEQQLAVQKNAYLGELIMKKLQERLATATDEERPKLESVQHAVAMRVQDLRTMEQVNMQFFVSIDMTIDNNRLLKQSVDRTITVTTSLLTVGLAIQAALARQKKVLDATRATQDYAADLLKANAASIRRQSTEIAELHTNPVLALDKVKAAHDDLLAAIEETEKIKKQGVAKATEGIAALSKMSETMGKKAGVLRSEEKEKTEASIEA
ncbi:MAG: toxic anion resistance protein, partial [Deltaproteobacteria bacterium]|nr:toxic anion resistance protein [Deltaproteobacteria bacterium]